MLTRIVSTQWHKESNREAIYALCDMLGLEKVYLDKWKDEKVGGK